MFNLKSLFTKLFEDKNSQAYIINNLVDLWRKDPVANREVFLSYFRNNTVHCSMKGNDVVFPGGRIVYEKDIYNYLKIDGLWVKYRLVNLIEDYKENNDYIDEVESVLAKSIRLN